MNSIEIQHPQFASFENPKKKQENGINSIAMDNRIKSKFAVNFGYRQSMSRIFLQYAVILGCRMQALRLVSVLLRQMIGFLCYMKAIADKEKNIFIINMGL